MIQISRLKQFLILVLLVSFQFTVICQDKFTLDELVVTIDDNKIRDFEANWNSITGIKNIKLLSNRINAYRLTIDIGLDLDEAINLLIQNSTFKSIQKNYYVENRAVPNDEFFPSQWSLDKIEIEPVWDLTTGGVSGGGYDIVVAILDDGFEADHEDLVNNIYSNLDEIPNNGIDDDNNGYVDDYNGWNFDSNNDSHSSLNHGTAVAGIIGAEGDNLIGISGVNQNIKMLYLSGVNQLSEIIEAYDYVIATRKMFNDTNGERGAYIVATNFSAGIPMRFGSEFPSWCSLYDELGLEGVLSATAADNDSYDVDAEGDMPTTCQSPYLITVTNTDLSDVLDAAYGNENVDVGAPGDGIITTDVNNQFDTFLGTSASSPHVAGAIALLHSVSCEFLVSAVETSPSSVASSIRQAIIDGVDPLTSLNGTSVSGGRINLFSSFKIVQDLCGGTSGELNVIHTAQNDSPFIKFRFETPDFQPYEFIVFDALGKIILKQTLEPAAFGEKSVSVDSIDWPSGVYFYTIYNDESKSSGSFYKH